MSPHPYTEDQLVEQPAIALPQRSSETTIDGILESRYA
jgi:hypothetical protein